MQKRTKLFWERDCKNIDDKAFKYIFRVNRSSFSLLCTYLKGLTRKDSNFRKCIPLEKRVAIALCALGSAAEYRLITNLFGVGASTVCQLVIEFCQEVWKQMKQQYLSFFPLEHDKVKECVEGFNALGLWVSV